MGGGRKEVITIVILTFPRVSSFLPSLSKLPEEINFNNGNVSFLLL